MPNIRFFDHLSVYSDFCGDGGQGEYATYAFLLCNHKPLEFASAMSRIRKRYGIGHREIAYKKIAQQRGIQAALRTYLSIVNDLVPGLLCTVTVPHKVENMMVEGVARSSVVSAQIHGISDAPPWKTHIAEKAARVLHVIAYLVALLGRGGQSVTWFCDNDAILENDKSQVFSARLLDSLLDDHCSFDISKVAYALPFEEREDMSYLDLLSITDLSAGAIRRKVADINGNNQKQKSVTPHLEKWLAEDGLACRKLHVVFDATTSGLRVHRM